jgi:FlaA1/EpsC-like NDP-sugar epimerase
VYSVLNYSFGLYSPQRAESITSETKQILKINIIGLLILITALYVIEVGVYSRYLLAMFAVFSTTFMIIERFFFRSFLRYVRRKGYNQQYMLVIGAGDLGEKFANKIKQNFYIGYNIMGFLDDNKLIGEKISNSKVIGSIDDLEKVIINNTVDMAIITIGSRHYKLIENLLNTLEKYGVKAEIVPDYYRYFNAKPAIDMIDDIPVINIRYVPLDNNLNRLIKRISDVILVTIGVIIISPILLVTAILVKLSSPGPVIFNQKRVGNNRKEFYIYKFRSMKVQEKEDYHWTKAILEILKLVRLFVKLILMNYHNFSIY